jgi:hypothetical protein
MLAPERPKIRPHVIPAQDDRDPHHVYLIDQLGISPRPQRLAVHEFLWIRLFDGQRTLRDIQLHAIEQAGGQLLPLEVFAGLARRLDEALLLESARFQEVVQSPVREPRCIGCYEADPAALRRQLEGLFTHRAGPGLPSERKPTGRLRAALLPHIDYGRGGITYAWGFKEVVEQTDASLFVIIGTSHYSSHRFTLTRKDFKTPLGLAPTDQDYIDRLVRHYGDGLFDDELMAHLPEHSIKLEVVLLQYLYERRRAIRIVPLVVGSFMDSVLMQSEPRSQSDIGRMIRALQAAERETKEPICYIISGDLAHIGPKFDDPLPVSAPQLAQSRAQDERLMEHAAAVDAEGYFRVIAEEADARRICGLPPTYTVLEAAKPRRGKLLHYDQYVHPRGYESVSFASVAFYR